MNAPYGIGSRDYLGRAKKLLSDSSCESMFYAALELRCGTEARMREYLEVADEICQKKKQGWQIAKLGNDLERAFKVGDRIVQITFENMTTGKQCRTYYTPVSSKLRKQAECMGDYLHALKTYREPDNDWWKTLRVFLNETFEALSAATRGTLLGPPLFRPGGKRLKTHHEIGVDSASDEAMRTIAGAGATVTIDVQYFDKLPVE